MTEYEIGLGGEDAPARVGAEADAISYVDDGEFATVWVVERTHDSQVHVQTWYCEAGQWEFDSGEAHTIHEELETDEFALEMAKADPEVALEQARDHYGVTDQ